MASPLFSIVVTGYQNGPYLDKALSSIAEQSYGDFEVLCYVEKSTDNSLDICQSFSQKDNRFKTITAEKSGSAAATRNYGIENATGEYLLALDGDDWFAPEMLQQLATKLDQTGPLDVLAFVGQKDLRTYSTVEIYEISDLSCYLRIKWSRQAVFEPS